MSSVFNFGAVLADKAKRSGVADFNARYRSRESGYQDRLNGFAPQSGDAEYFSGYCEALCNEIAAESGRNNRACWYGLAD